VTRDSIVAEEWTFAPGRTVECGPIVTKYDIRVGVSSPGTCVPVVGNAIFVEEDVGDGPAEDDGDALLDAGADADANVPGAAPMIAFSLMMHPSPTEIGPSKA
jgi:hypothetical protein